MTKRSVAWGGLVGLLLAGTAGAGVSEPETGGVRIPAADPHVGVMGRVERLPEGGLRIGYPGVTLRLRLEGSAATMRVATDTPKQYVSVFVDGADPVVVGLPEGPGKVPLAQGLGPGAHDVDIVRRSETWHGVMTVSGFDLPEGARLLAPRPWPERRLLFLGDSVTCGEKIDERPSRPGETPYAGWNAYLSYGMLVARALDAQCHLVCYGGRGVIRDWQGRSDVLNAPGFLDLAVPVENDPPAWDHGSYDPDAVVISLGTNDFNLAIGPLPDREEFVSRYVELVARVRGHHPGAHIFLTEGAIVSDEADPERPQRTVLREYLAEIARRLDDPRLHVVEALHYPGDAADGHPTLEQHAAMAEDLAPVLRAALGW